MSERKGLRFDDVVENLVHDPYHVPDSVVVSGLIGKSNQEGYVRIYTTPDLKTWLEIAKDDILHSEELEDQGSRVWLRDGAKVQQVTTSSLTAQNGFLHGKLAAAHLGAAAPSAPASQMNAGDQAMTATIVLCTPRCTMVNCTWGCLGGDGLNAGVQPGTIVLCTPRCTMVNCTWGCLGGDGLNAGDQTIVLCTPRCTMVNCTWGCRGGDGLNAGNQAMTATIVLCTVMCTTIVCPNNYAGANDFTAVINPGNINPQSAAAVTPPQLNPNIAPRRTT